MEGPGCRSASRRRDPHPVCPCGQRFGDRGGGEAAAGAAPRPVGKLVALVFFIIILTLVVYGLAWLIFTSLGFKVGFNGPFPTFSK